MRKGALAGEGYERVVEALEAERDKLLSICGSFRLGQGAEDLIQEAALLALEKCKTVQNLEAWLRGVVWRFCIQEARKRGRNLERWEPLDVERESPVSGVAEEYDRGVLLQEIKIALPERDWNLIWWIYGERLPLGEIAERLGCSIDSIGNMRRRALAKARSFLARSRQSSRRIPEVKESAVVVQSPIRSRQEVRNEALVQLYESGVKLRDLVSLQLADVSLDGGEVVLRRGSSSEERRGLPGEVLEALQSWMAIRGGNPGPLFLSALGGGGLTAKGVSFTLWRHRKEAGIRTSPMSKQLEFRNVILKRLYKAGLTHMDLASLRVEDVGEWGVRLRERTFDLEQKLLSVLREWIGRRSSGPVFISQSGTREALTPVGIRWVLLELGVWKKPPVQRRRRRQGRQPENEIWTEKRAVCRLWEDLPQPMRRREPNGFDEEDLVVRLVRLRTVRPSLS